MSSESHLAEDLAIMQNDNGQLANGKGGQEPYPLSYPIPFAPEAVPDKDIQRFLAHLYEIDVAQKTNEKV